jgi:hypothetical protein
VQHEAPVLGNEAPHERRPRVALQTKTQLPVQELRGADALSEQSLTRGDERLADSQSETER